MFNRKLIVFLALCALWASPALAQNATLNCTVVDGSNAPVPGAAAILKTF